MQTQESHLSELKCNECGKTAELSDGLCQQCRSVNTPTLAPTLPPTIAPKTTAGTGSRDEAIKPGNMPQQFGEYELIEEIARGGMGVVYKARHQRLNRVAALKMILSGRFSSEDELQRFHIEAESAAKLDHSGIVPVYEIGEVDGQPFFAMKYIEGGSLAEQMTQLRDDPDKGMALLAKVAKAVHHAHQRGVLHRDLKPGNILLDEEGHPLVTDLGLAKNTTNDSNLTNTGAVMGTPAYMPPEQASGGGVTTAADIYSLGAIMYQLLTGQPPHQGESAIDTMMRVMKGPPETPSKKDKGVDRYLEAICMKCLEFDPESRYSSALQLANDLEAWSTGDSISVRSPSFVARTKRWLQANTRLVYAAFMALAGALFTAPFALGLFMGPEVAFRDVYSRFPADQTPWIFQFEAEMPGWTFPVAVVLLMLIFYPSIGFLNAIFARTKSMTHAIGAGMVTSSVLMVLFGTMIGWVSIVNEVSNQSRPAVNALSNVVWTPEGMTPEQAVKKANSIYKGLEEIPAHERAAVLAARVRADQFATALNSILKVVVLCTLLALPIILGTVIAHVLLQRNNWIIVRLVRYYTAWLTTLTILAFSCFYLFQVEGPVVNGKPLRDSPKEFILILTFCSVIAFLVLRRWKKKSPVKAKHPTTSLPTQPQAVHADA